VVPAWTIAVAGFQLRFVSLVIALSRHKKTGRKSRAGFLSVPLATCLTWLQADRQITTG
jgi:hypothetical protein